MQSYTSSVGRVTYPEQINLWDDSSNEPKDFTTNFSFVVSSNQSSLYGDEKWWTNVTQGEVCNCSIVYNSRNNILKVSFTENKLGGGDATQIIQHLSYHVNITDQLSKSVTVGISAATGEYTEEHTLFSWSFSTSTSSPTPSKGHSKKGRINTILLEGTGIGTEVWPRWFGGFHKGYFKGLNSYAAMKRISAGSAQSLKEYAEEVTIISQLRHMNLVKLAGWCHKKNDLFLIYEYMPNGSLDSCLFGGEKFLPWKVRYNVALGLASAWLYLQEECEKFVFHREIKSSNIMVDSNFSAKLGDFGLARQVDHEKGSQSSVGESDTFSFGVVLLEVATGRKAIHHKDMEGGVSLVEWAWEHHGLRNLLAATDPNLCAEFDVQQTECLLVVGLCKTRPSIRQVIKVLNFEAPFPILPPQIPVLNNLPPTTNMLVFTASP
ncbi:hypothetical protein GYH30_020447 [Glycine max]|nr:hypothetical protein GYH30_020447 [Glycine max]